MTRVQPEYGLPCKKALLYISTLTLLLTQGQCPTIHDDGLHGIYPPLMQAIIMSLTQGQCPTKYLRII